MPGCTFPPRRGAKCSRRQRHRLRGQESVNALAASWRRGQTGARDRRALLAAELDAERAIREGVKLAARL
jgi:hypothetical protein